MDHTKVWTKGRSSLTWSWTIPVGGQMCGKGNLGKSDYGITLCTLSVAFYTHFSLSRCAKISLTFDSQCYLTVLEERSNYEDLLAVCRPILNTRPESCDCQWWGLCLQCVRLYRNSLVLLQKLWWLPMCTYTISTKFSEWTSQYHVISLSMRSVAPLWIALNLSLFQSFWRERRFSGWAHSLDVVTQTVTAGFCPKAPANPWVLILGCSWTHQLLRETPFICWVWYSPLEPGASSGPRDTYEGSEQMER